MLVDEFPESVQVDTLRFRRLQHAARLDGQAFGDEVAGDEWRQIVNEPDTVMLERFLSRRIDWLVENSDFHVAAHEQFSRRFLSATFSGLDAP